jgi:hypothetical protein
MPSFGRIKKLTVLGVAVAALGVTTTAASAATNDVWLWACHGPNGEPLSSDSVGDNHNLTRYSGGCESTDNNIDDGGLRGQFPIGNTRGSWNLNLTVPPGTQLTKVRLQRRVTGLTPDFEYSSKALGAPLAPAASSDVAAGEPVFDITPGSTNGGTVQIALECKSNPCPAANPVTMDIARVGLKVTDATPPAAAVGGVTSPARGALSLNVQASDNGTGLRSAIAYIDGIEVDRDSFGGEGCADLTSDASTVDMRLDADCPHVDALDLTADTAGFAEDQVHELKVTVFDWAGNESSYASPIEVDNVFDLGQSSQELKIGTSGTTTNPTVNSANNTGTGGVAGASAQSCRSPRLSFSLSNKPMRISKGVPVLQYGKRYRFNGRLTCVINGKRKSAPKRARVDILNKIGKKTYEKAGTTVRDSGKLTVILSYKSSRTISFRFTSSDGKRSTVSIKVKVEKKKSSRR